MLRQGESVDSNDPRIHSAVAVHRGLNKFNAWSNKNIPLNSVDFYMHGSLYHTYKPILKAIPVIRNDFKKVFAEKFPDLRISPKAAFVHVRRGDYLKAFAKDLQTISYYKAGIELLKKAGIEEIYLLSDDMKWCKSHLKGLNLTPFEGDELKTLYLMSMCKAGAVISASTYSAWGAILGPDENKRSVIVYPKIWLGQSHNPHGWPSRWTAI
jgi:hypothetical protein